MLSGMITGREIIDIILMTLAVGYIFKDAFPRLNNDLYSFTPTALNWKDIQFAMIVTAPAVILHELAHKFVALGFGTQATFHAHYLFLGLGVILKLLNVGFIFFIPGYVSHGGDVTLLQSSLIAVAGPLLNLLLWTISVLLIKKNMVQKKFKTAVELTGKINMFLFFLNMIPIPPFDGFAFFRGLLEFLF